MRTKLLPALFAALMLTSCAQPRYTTAPFFTNNPAAQKAEIQLAHSAKNINKSLFELAQIKRAVYPHVKMPTPPNANKIGLGHTASIDWSGPIEPLVRNITKATGYKLRILGRAPAVPILVSITANNVPIATILRDAAYQCGNKVNLVAYPKRKVIELRYAKI